MIGLAIFFFSNLVSNGQEIERKNAFSLQLGFAHLTRQDRIFSPMVHRDGSVPNFRIQYDRNARFSQRVLVSYASFQPMVNGPYEFYMHGVGETAGPHYFTMVDLSYRLGKSTKLAENSTLDYGGFLQAKVQAMSYVYGRISSFGYLAPFGLGLSGTYHYEIQPKGTVSASLNLPLVSWVARSPFLVNDDTFIENIASHNSLTTFLAYVGDGKLGTWNTIQYFDLELAYQYRLGERWQIGAAYWFEFIHHSQPRPLLSFRNSLNLTGTFSF